MANSDNLGLYLPTKNDTVNVTRDLTNNFKKIDDACGTVNITNTLTFSEKIDTSNMRGGVFRTGKIINVQIRFTVTSQVSSSDDLITGFPTYEGSANVVFLNGFNTVNGNPVSAYHRYLGTLRVASGSTLTANSNYCFTYSYISNE